MVTDVVVAGQTVVGAEGLSLNGFQRRFDHVAPGHIPPWGESGFVEGQRLAGVGDHLIAVADHEVA